MRWFKIFVLFVVWYVGSVSFLYLIGPVEGVEIYTFSPNFSRFSTALRGALIVFPVLPLSLVVLKYAFTKMKFLYLALWCFLINAFTTHYIANLPIFIENEYKDLYLQHPMAFLYFVFQFVLCWMIVGLAVSAPSGK